MSMVDEASQETGAEPAEKLTETVTDPAVGAPVTEVTDPATDGVMPPFSPTDAAGEIAEGTPPPLITGSPAPNVKESHLVGADLERASVGFLTITPDQKILTPEQRAAFSALGVDPNDPVARAHCQRFVHVCQLWGVDPWSGEIHLVQRGKIHDNGEDKRSWTIQTGIDGYRRRARDISNAPGAKIRLIGKARWFWSYGDDDDNSWRAVPDPDTGDMVMQPVWWAAWPDTRPHPAMAKAVIKVEDLVSGEIRNEEFVAHWDMFAAMEDVWENRKRVLLPDGKPKRKLGAFWERGKAHMLGKCAEASVLRAVFHGYFHGVVTHEEMGIADTDAAHDLEEAVARQRREAFAKAQLVPGKAALDGAAIIQARLEPEPEDASPPPVRLGDLLPGAAHRAALLEQVKKDANGVTLLRDELAFMADVLNISPKDMAASLGKRAGIDAVDMDEQTLLSWIGPLRTTAVIPALRAADRHAEADAYSAFGQHAIAPVDMLRGIQVPDPTGDAAPVEPEDDQPDPHAFDPREDDDTQCSECVNPAGHEIHREENALPTAA